MRFTVGLAIFIAVLGAAFAIGWICLIVKDARRKRRGEVAFKLVVLVLVAVVHVAAWRTLLAGPIDPLK